MQASFECMFFFYYEYSLLKLILWSTYMVIHMFEDRTGNINVENNLKRKEIPPPFVTK